MEAVGRRSTMILESFEERIWPVLQWVRGCDYPVEPGCAS